MASPMAPGEVVPRVRVRGGFAICDGAMLALRAGFVVFLLTRALSAAGQSLDVGPSPEPTLSPLPKRPIADSVGPVVERYLRENAHPCSRAEAERLPCFPVSVEVRGPAASVAESFRAWKPDTSPGAVPNGMPVTPFGLPVVGVSFDPVCAGKSLLKGLTGKNNTYYLYRVWTRQGEHAIMQDRPLEPGGHLAVTAFEYEFLRKIDGECEAIAAWRKANREAEERNRALAPK